MLRSIFVFKGEYFLIFYFIFKIYILKTLLRIAWCLRINITQHKFIEYGRKTSVFFLLACSLCYQGFFQEEKVVAESFIFFCPMWKGIKYCCWLTAVAKPQVHSLGLLLFQMPFFVTHCCPQVLLLTLACLWLYIHIVWHTNYCLSQASSSLTLTRICFVGKVECTFSFLLHFWVVISSIFVLSFV